MPGFDRTGPEGQGSRTGRGLGKCNPNKQASGEQFEQENSPRGFRGRGRRHGRGLGRGFGRGLGRGNASQNL